MEEGKNGKRVIMYMSDQIWAGTRDLRLFNTRFILCILSVVEEKKGKLLYKRDKKGDYASFCV